MYFYLTVDDDIDGVPLEADGGGGLRTAGTFVPSRWESVEPDALGDERPEERPDERPDEPPRPAPGAAPPAPSTPQHTDR